VEQSPKTTPNANRQEAMNLSLRDIFYKYIRFAPLLVLSVAIALLGAFIYLRYATNIYGSAATLLIKQENRSSNSQDRVEDILSGGNRVQNLQNEIEVLKSRQLMMRVVNKLNLEISYSLEGRVKDMNMYGRTPFQLEVTDTTNSRASFELPLHFQEDGGFRITEEGKTYQLNEEFVYAGNRMKVIRTGEIPANAVFRIRSRSAEMVARALIKDLKVMPKTAGTGILQIGMEASSPQLSADIINTLMLEYGAMTVEQNNYSADTMIAFIGDRLTKLKDEIDSIQLIELNFRQKQNLFNVDIQSENYFTNLADVNKAISEQELRISTVDNIETYVRGKENKFVRVVPSSLGLEDLTLNDLVMSYNKAQLERQLLLNANIPSRHPAIRESEEVIEKQRQNLVENLGNMRGAYRNTIGKLRQQLNNEEGSLKEMPYKVKQLVELERQIAAKQALYTLLEGKREETAISRASTVSNSSVIDAAEASDIPVKPNRRLIQMLAVAIGFIIPALIIILTEVLNDKVNTRLDVEKLTSAPIVGEVGHSYSNKVLVINKTSRGMVAEQFRIIRSNLQYVLNDVEKPVILVTSSFSGEGKSFVSTNMAAVMALTDKKTILLEFDIRKPKVLSGLNMGKHPGISNYLLGKTELKDLILPVAERDNFFILPCGPIPPNPSEILLDRKIDEMFTWLKANFEVIIIDTAPIGMVSDAMTLSKFADCTLYLVRQGHTFRKQLVMIDELYRDKKLPKVSIIINDVKQKAGYGYYGYGRYGYGYGYGEKSGYYEEEKPDVSLFKRILNALNPVMWFKK